ncbi:E3 ubiquitin-protein ligase RBBP6-like isoform X2 [Bacillus rossius redtenbacheri]|uniref:E3 ubiquitin-protein ligase RBBP6-like isoform X2 n=1 Tax=Bacillus rossius redtenbacheri TaxID=93214 RepID=UPI002FDDCDE8
MSVHYKFKSTLEYDTVTFDGLHISVRELKKAILYQKRIGKNTDFDLQVTNAQTKEVYTDDNTLIPKNTSLIVARIPLTAQQKKAWDRSEANQQLAGVQKNIEVLDSSESGVLRLAKAVDLTSLDASEEDKIQAMMTQSTQDYSPSNYIKIRGANQMGEVPPSYRCYKCHQTGHWIKNCPLIANQDPIDYKKSTGIPRSFMVVVEGPSVPGAMMTPTGEFAVPAIDHQAYKEGKKEKPPFQPEPELVVEKPEIPEDLLCTVCKDLLTDAIMIPCCGNSFCDDCIRTVLLESEDHECPDCKEKDVSPDSLIPNRFLRNAVNNFKNETGYHRTTPKIHLPVAAAEAVPSRVSVVATVSVSVSATQNTASTAHPQVAPVPLLAAHEPGGGGAAPLQSQFEPAVAADPSLAQTCDNTVSTIPVLGSTGVMVPHHHSVNVPVVLTATPIKDVPPASVGPVVPLMPAVAAPEAASSAEKPVVQVAAESAAPAVALSPAVALRVLDTKEAVASAKPAHGDGPVSHIEPVTSRVSVPTTLSSQVATQLVKVPVSASGTPSVQVTTALPQAQAPIKLPPLRVAEHTHLPPQPIYPPHSARLSVEDRPGTPTIDERNLEGGSTHLVAALPDTSVPPPNFNPPPPGETPQHFQIKTLEPMRSQRLGLSYRQEHSYGHRGTRLGGQASDYIPGPMGPLSLRPPAAPDHSRAVVPQPAPVTGSYPHSQYDHNRPSYHHDSGSGGRSSYSDVDRDSHLLHRGSYRGYRNRGRALHGGYRGHSHHHPSASISRGVHNGSQASTIDDPLEAFERMLREKDRKRKLRHPRRSRSFSRSRSNSRSSRSYSRSRSRSPSRTRTRSRTRSRSPRSRTRTPRKRSRTRTKSRTRSPSGSFSISSKSRSRSFSRSPPPPGRGVVHGSPRDRDRDRDRKRDREREVSPRRRASPHFRSPAPARQSPPPSRYHSSYKDVRTEFENSSYYETDYQQYPAAPASRGGRGSRYRKDYNKDYYDQSYNRYNNDRYTSRETRAVEPLLPAPPGVTQYDANPTSYHRYNQYDVAPPGTGPDIPGIGSYDKMHYDRGYDRAPAHEARPSTTEYLTPPGVDMRSDYTGRECDVAMLSFRDKGAPPSRDRDPVVTSVLRDSRDVSSSGRDNNWSREGDHVASRDRDADRERNKDYYETDYRHTYESKSYSYNSPDRKKRHSTSPSRRGGSRDRYSGGDQHRHSRSDGRRKGSQRDTGKENRHTSQQPVEALDVSGDRDRDRDHNKDKEVQKRERVLVEVRKEPSVDKDKLKKEKEEKSRKDDDDKSKDKKSKDKKKKKKDVDGEKMKKKKRREKKDGNKKDATDSKTSSNEKVRTGGQSQGKAAKKEAAQAVAKAQASASASASAAADNTVTKTAQPITVVIGEKKTKPPAIQHSESVVDALYGDMEDTRIDDVLVASYGKVEPLADGETAKVDTSEGASDSKAVGDIKEETAEVTEVEEQKGDNSDIAKANVVLAPLPEPSKWELDDELGDEKMMEERLGVTEEVVDKSGNKVVTSEVLKRAENAIFQKAINAIRPIEPAKKPSVGERKVYATNEKEKKIPAEPNVIDTIDITRKVAEKEAREARKTANSIQITIPIAGHVERSVELSTMENATARKEKPKLDRSKFGPGGSLLTSNQWGEVPDGTSPHRVPVKERLGAKVDAEAEKRRDESEREEKSRRQRHRSRSNSREHKQHGSRKGLNLKSAVERKRTVSRSRSRSPYHRKIIADRKFLEPLKYVDPIVAAMELRYLEPTDRRYLDPAIERKYMEHGLRRDARYPEGDRRLIERDIRRPDKHYESERRRERSDSHERDWARSKTREERDHSRHKVKKRTKNRSESRSRKKSILDREVKRSKKKEKKHKKDKVKKHKAKADKEEKKDTENVKVDEKNELAVEEGKQDTTNQVPETAKEKPKQTSQVESEGTAENKEKSKKGNRKNPRLASDRKKSTLDEASFEPDYDLSSSGESETEEAAAAEGAEKKPETQSGDKAASPKKRDRSASTEVASASAGTEKKRQKVEKEKEGEKSNDPDPKKASKTTGGKASKKREKFSSTEEDSSDDSSDDSDSSSGSSSSSDEDSSDGSSVRRRRKKRSSRKHRRKKGKRSRRTETSSDSDSDSDSDDASSSESGGGRRRGRSTKKHKHHSKRASKKKKKSKHR